MKRIRTFLVDDSIFFRTFLEQGLSARPEIEIVGSAANATDAKAKILSLKPDVVTLDVEMPGLTGIEFLKQLLPLYPVPVVLVSALNMQVFDALSAGAVDFVHKPSSQSPGMEKQFLDDLAVKLYAASLVKKHAPQPAAGRVTSAPAVKTPPVSSLSLTGKSQPVIALGASTGGTEATLTVLKQLPADTPGILIVQHMPPGFTKMYAERLNRLCAMTVKEAQSGDPVRPGLALIAPGDQHMRLVAGHNGYSVQCGAGEKISGHCPSVDALFFSVAKAAGSKAVGIIMTGMGRDGADGLLAMRKAGAYTIGQDEASCAVYGMPMVAYKLGAVAKQASCENIAFVLKTHLNTQYR